MSVSESYSIPAQNHFAEQEIKKSRFLTSLGHAANKTDAQDFIQTVRENYPDARHHCWAFVVSPPGDKAVFAMSDDGEPQGTAGKPMLQVLQYSQIGEIVAVVTRYFGGIKLGAGGLVRAYSSSVQQAIQDLPLKEVVPTRRASLSFPFSYENTIRHLLKDLGIKVGETDYGSGVEIEINIPLNHIETIQNQFKDKTLGLGTFYWKDINV